MLLLKTINIIFFLLMILFAAVQYNDPDGLFWAVAYLIPAICAGLVAFRPKMFNDTIPYSLLGACVVLGVIGSIIYWPTMPQFWVKEVWWNEETAREGMGVMIATLVMVFAVFSAWRSRSTNSLNG